MLRIVLAILAFGVCTGSAAADDKLKNPFGVEAVKTEKGVEVANVTKNGLANQMSLAPGDRFIRVKGAEVPTLEDLFRALGDPRGKIEVIVVNKFDTKRIIRGTISESSKERGVFYFDRDFGRPK